MHRHLGGLGPESLHGDLGSQVARDEVEAAAGDDRDGRPREPLVHVGEEGLLTGRVDVRDAVAHRSLDDRHPETGKGPDRCDQGCGAVKEGVQAGGVAGVDDEALGV